MPSISSPIQTPIARQWLEHPDATLDRVHLALLTTVNGHRSVVELESVARAMGLDPDVLHRLRRGGFVSFAEESGIAHGS